ncbi:MAG: response regulator, partial [Cohnella sp.]|nr:response regulator [Cohnella sp.]
DFKYAQEALRLGAVDYLLKPTEVEEIETVLKRAKEQHEAASLHAPEALGSTDAPASDEPNSYLIKKATQIIADRYHEDLHLSDLAGELFITPNYLSRLFRQETGKSFIELLTEIRLDKARTILAQDMSKIYEVGLAVGYPNPRYFSEWFQKNTGMSPGEYRKLHFRT